MNVSRNCRSLECAPPEYVLPGYKERPLMPLFPTVNEPIVALKSLAISPFNPPPGPRKMKVIFYLASTSIWINSSTAFSS